MKTAKTYFRLLKHTHLITPTAPCCWGFFYFAPQIDCCPYQCIYRAVDIMADLIGYDVDNEEIIAVFDIIIATIDE